MIITVFPFFFFFNDTATTEIYTLSLHDALPICRSPRRQEGRENNEPPFRLSSVAVLTLLLSQGGTTASPRPAALDRKSTRLNSSHANISYAVFCLKKKKKNNHTLQEKLSQFTYT